MRRGSIGSIVVPAPPLPFGHFPASGGNLALALWIPGGMNPLRLATLGASPFSQSEKGEGIVGSTVGVPLGSEALG